MNQKEFAEKIGFSYGSVSRAFNNRGQISEKNRQFILKEAERLGYQANMSARSLKMNKHFVIGIMIPSIDDSFRARLIQVIEEEFSQRGYWPIVFHRRTSKDIVKGLNLFIKRGVDGLLMMPPFMKSDELNKLYRLSKKENLPFLMLQIRTEISKFSFLGTNENIDMQICCDYLKGLGHKNILLIPGRKENPGVDERVKGFIDEMKEAGIKHPEKNIVFPEKGESPNAESLLNRNPRPTAIIAGNDALAFKIYKSLKKYGLKIPQDISIIGHGGLTEGELLTPPLTTIAINYEKLGKRAVEILLDKIENGNEETTYELISGKLLERESCREV